MFTPVLQGTIISDDSLQVFYDFGDSKSYIPAFGTTVYDLGPKGTNATLVGGPVYRTDFGGCVQFDGVDDNITYTGAFSGSFTTIFAHCPTNSSAPSTMWGNDDGAFPGYAVNNGYLNVVQNPVGQTVLIRSGGTQTLLTNTFTFPNTIPEFRTVPVVTAFTTNGSNSHKVFTNNFRTIASTQSITARGASAIGTINIGRDTQLATRYPIGRVIAYLHYNRELSEDEVYQNHSYFLNRFIIKGRNSNL